MSIPLSSQEIFYTQIAQAQPRRTTASLSDDINTLIFETVPKYIIDTKRF